jgi:hypothetical protein
MVRVLFAGDCAPVSGAKVPQPLGCGQTGFEIGRTASAIDPAGSNGVVTLLYIQKYKVK